jgi:hypothetical protein
MCGAVTRRMRKNVGWAGKSVSVCGASRQVVLAVSGLTSFSNHTKNTW